MYIDKLDDIFNNYNNTYNRAIKKKPIIVISSTLFDFDVESNDKDCKFNVSDQVRISKYNKISAKGYPPNCWDEIFVIKKVKNTRARTCHRKPSWKGNLGMFHEKQMQKTNQAEFRIEKLIKKEGDKQIVNWKRYNNSFNSWIDKKIPKYEMSYYPEPDSQGRNKSKVELDFPNYATKSDEKGVIVVNISDFAKRFV